MNTRKMTAEEVTIVETLRRTGSIRATSLSTGASRDKIRRVKLLAEVNGVPIAQTPVAVQDGTEWTKTTVQYNAQGIPVQEWRRLRPSAQALIELADKLAEKVGGKGRVPRHKPRKTDTADHLLEVCLSDAHIGMYAWRPETGEAGYDVDEATRTVIAATEDITAQCRPAEILLVLNGDTMHSDNRSGTTERSGNVLDMDGRFGKVLDHTVECVTEAVRICCERAPKVTLRVIPGNHDWHMSLALARIFAAYYRGQSGIEVEQTLGPRAASIWGQCLVAHAHGDRIKATDWPALISTAYPREWGMTRFRYLRLGHVHHRNKRYPIEVLGRHGLEVEYVRALCPPDAYHSENGYLGNVRGADGFLYHKNRGQVARWSFNADQVA